MAFQPQLNPLGLPLIGGAPITDPALLAQQQIAGAALGRLLAASLTGGTGTLNPADQMNVDLSQGPPAANLGGMMDWLGGGSTPGCANCSGGGTPALGGGPASSSSAPAAGGAGGKGELQGPKDAGPASGATGEWGPEDEKFLTEAVSKGGASNGPAAGGDTSKQFEEIFNDFGQTSEGNCATVAVVKAALDKYGTKMFNSVQKQGDGFQVQQQDGKSVNITSAELKKAAQSAKLKGKPSAAKSMAVLAYAVVGKNSGGVDKLGNGADPKKIAQALGLGNKMKDVSPQEAAQSKDGAVAWNNTHAVYQANGKTDAYGKEQQANGTAAGRGQLTKAFVFV